MTERAPHAAHGPDGPAGHDGQARHGRDRRGSHPPDRHAGHSVAMFRDRFWLSLLLTLPILIWSPDLQEWLGYQAPSFPGSDLIPPILGTIVFVYGGRVFPRAPSPSCRPGSRG
jgi:Cu2+-exporting ATPase